MGSPLFLLRPSTSLYSCRMVFLTLFSSHIHLSNVFTWPWYLQVLWGHHLLGPHTHFWLSSFSLNCLIHHYPKLPCTYPLGSSQAWFISTLVIATFYQSVLGDPSSFPSRHQFPISKPHRWGLKPIITCLLSQGLLISMDLRCNTPILSMCKASRAYCLVWDLCLINEAIVLPHKVVINSYTLLSNIPLTNFPLYHPGPKRHRFYCPSTPWLLFSLCIELGEPWYMVC